MHALSHSLAHRGQPATRSKPRWQPYHASLRTPTQYLITPASSVSSSPPAPHPIPPHKSKYAAGLVDQAVRTLVDIWQVNDIPPVFLTSRPHVQPAPVQQSEHHKFAYRNNQLPSPISPSTHPSPISPHFAKHPVRSATEPCLASPVQRGGGDLAPMKTFVHEVLRRSRTSGNVLQTALCYIEAVRSKIPHLVLSEKEGHSTGREQELADRIVKEEVDAGTSADFVGNHSSAEAETVRIDDVEMDMPFGDNPSFQPRQLFEHRLALPCTRVSSLPHILQPQAPPSTALPLPLLPPTPSPLLCPRRTFLASLILASKFLQDRCYSNRAWAKLAGLPPREIGRCERALGEALGWRLWVGKVAASPVTQSATALCARGLERRRSESELSSSQILPVPMPALDRQLRRHATVPAGLPRETLGWALSASSSVDGSSTGSVDGSITPSNVYTWHPSDAELNTPSITIATYSPPSSSWPRPSFQSTNTLPSFTSSASSSHPLALNHVFNPTPPTPDLIFSPASSSSSSGDGERTPEVRPGLGRVAVVAAGGFADVPVNEKAGKTMRYTLHAYAPYSSYGGEIGVGMGGYHCEMGIGGDGR